MDVLIDEGFLLAGEVLTGKCLQRDAQLDDALSREMQEVISRCANSSLDVARRLLPAVKLVNLLFDDAIDRNQVINYLLSFVIEPHRCVSTLLVLAGDHYYRRDRLRQIHASTSINIRERISGWQWFGDFYYLHSTSPY